MNRAEQRRRGLVKEKSATKNETEKVAIEQMLAIVSEEMDAITTEMEELWSDR